MNEDDPRRRRYLAVVEKAKLIGASDLEAHAAVAQAVSFATRGKYSGYCAYWNSEMREPFLTPEMLRNAKRRWDRKVKKHAKAE